MKTAFVYFFLSLLFFFIVLYEFLLHIQWKAFFPFFCLACTSLPKSVDHTNMIFSVSLFHSLFTSLHSLICEYLSSCTFTDIAHLIILEICQLQYLIQNSIIILSLNSVDSFTFILFFCFTLSWVICIQSHIIPKEIHYLQERHWILLFSFVSFTIFH